MSNFSPTAGNAVRGTFFPRVSVVVPIYNGEADLPDLVSCLLAQSYPGDRVEYLLVDNGSRDRTSTLLQMAVRAGTEQGLTLRSFTEAEIQSSYAARNVGIRAAQGEILAFTDADCRPISNWLEQLVQPFTDAAVGLVAGEVKALPGNTLLERFADRQETLSQKHTLAHSFLPYGQTANLAVRRHILEQSGLFRPYLTTGGDADLCWRIQQQGNWQLHFAEEAIVQHRHRTTLPELRRQWQRYGTSNRYLHELHGVDLMRTLSLSAYAHRWMRWLLKELPGAGLKMFSRKADLSVMLETPINLLCIQARASGQRQAGLPAAAREIAWLDQRPSEPETDRPNG
ncbi:glycosyltransferase [Oculatella sp. LEGE 06141]|uniref:glycosyltransferase n=1 Tax=Oculatella sp. LEGE 06141 TaxID=1828648 RepID=UPI0018812D54|nr:glycosyltransferase [Oculatella sp. LEGE 06141]MBE9177891.1 glycosyltransferase [Oculatella sp. LEGE 06141]